MLNSKMVDAILEGEAPEYMAFAIEADDTHDVIKVKRNAAQAIAGLLSSLRDATDRCAELGATIQRRKRAW